MVPKAKATQVSRDEGTNEHYLICTNVQSSDLEKARNSDPRNNTDEP